MMSTPGVVEPAPFKSVSEPLPLTANPVRPEVALDACTHPLNVETVAWVSERKSLLSMLFSLLAVASYGWYVRTPELAGAQKWRRYLAVMFFFALAFRPCTSSVRRSG